MKHRIFIALIALILCLASQVSQAQNSANKSAQKQESEPCRGQKLDLSGTYTGVLFTDKNQKEGTPAKLTVSDNDFELTSETLIGSGFVSGVNSCGDVAIALRFTAARGQGDSAKFQGAVVSMEARVAGGHGEWNGEKMMSAKRPIIWATARDNAGNLAGADIAFVICPEYPKCKKYKTCPCPEPPK